MLEEHTKSTPEQPSSVEMFHCPNCHANLRFDTQEQALKCDFCETIIEIDSNGGVEEYNFFNLELLERQSNWNKEAIAFQCKSCGAEIITESHETATRCPYCDSSHIIQHQQFSGMRPEGIIPFKITKEEATQLFGKWTNRQWLAPRKLKQHCRMTEFSGVYIPFWTYDAYVQSSYTGKGGKHYYKTRTVNGRTEREQCTRWYSVNGYLSHRFDDVLVCASKGLNHQVVQNIEPFHTQSALSYKSEYLSGFKAEHYVIDAKDGYDLAQTRIVDELKQMAAAEIERTYDTSSDIKVNPFYSDVKFKHILLPIWILTYTYNKKVYRCLINGETGKVQGSAPTCPWKVAGLVLLAAFIYYFFFNQ